jgi:hypothetical protein
MVLAVAVLMAVMLVAIVAPAFAAPNPDRGPGTCVGPPDQVFSSTLSWKAQTFSSTPPWTAWCPLDRLLTNNALQAKWIRGPES